MDNVIYSWLNTLSLPVCKFLDWHGIIYNHTTRKYFQHYYQCINKTNHHFSFGIIEKADWIGSKGGPKNNSLPWPSTPSEERSSPYFHLAMSNIKGNETSKKFEEFISANQGLSPAIAAVKTLLYLIKNNKGTTVNGTISELRAAVAEMEKITGKSKLAVSSACNQAVRFITLNLATIEYNDMSACTVHMEEQGRKYLGRCEKSISRVAKRGSRFIFDGARVMVHSNSRVVLETLKAVSENIQFSVYIVCNKNLEENYRVQLKERSNIECHAIYDAEVGYRMENIDLVMVGAEAVVKNGGIINKVGTLPLAICAKEMNKPLYVLAESFKFSILYPLNQEDIPEIYQEGEDGHARVDYTLPKYITLHVTDRGLLTPTAVCDELIEMYI